MIFQTDKDIAIEELELALGVLSMYPKTNDERMKSIKRIIEYLKPPKREGGSQ